MARLHAEPINAYLLLRGKRKRMQTFVGFEMQSYDKKKKGQRIISN